MIFDCDEIACIHTSRIIIKTNDQKFVEISLLVHTQEALVHKKSLIDIDRV